MNDLLSNSFEKNSKDEVSKEKDVEMGSLPSNKSQYGMEDFFKQVRETETLMERLSMLLKKLEEANMESRAITKASAMKALRQRMDKDINEARKIVLNVKTKLEEIDRDNLSNRKKPDCGKGTAVDRSRMAMTVALKKKLKEKMSDFQNLRQTIQDEYREAVERRVYTVTGAKATDEMIDHLIETGNSEQILQNAIQEMGRGQMIDTVEEIQERHDAVKEIEKKLLELHQVFMDMAVLVEAQGEILDNIEIQVTNAVNHVQSGTEALQTAKGLMKNSSKCMLIGIAILLIIAILIVLSICLPRRK